MINGTSILAMVSLILAGCESRDSSKQQGAAKESGAVCRLVVAGGDSRDIYLWLSKVEAAYACPKDLHDQRVILIPRPEAGCETLGAAFDRVNAPALISDTEAYDEAVRCNPSENVPAAGKSPLVAFFHDAEDKLSFRRESEVVAGLRHVTVRSGAPLTQMTQGLDYVCLEFLTDDVRELGFIVDNVSGLTDYKITTAEGTSCRVLGSQAGVRLVR